MFQQAIKFDCLVLAIFQRFEWFVIYVFGKLVPPFQINVSKDALDHFLVHFRVLNISNNGKHIAVFFFVPLVL